MRHIVRSLALAGIIASALATGHSAQAQSFPNPPTNANPFWVPMRRANAIITDPIDANADARDLVGDATHPAAYLATDATFLYFRLRVNGSPGAIGAIADNRGFGCLIDTNGTLTNYEVIAALDGNDPDVVRYHSNTTAGTANTSNNPAETQIVTFPAATHARVSTADTTFSGNADSFVDIAVPWATIRTGGVTAATSLRFICGTTSNAATANDLATDIFDGAASLTLQPSWTDAYVCNGGSNQLCTQTPNDTDGDGVPNAEETLYGTNPASADSDGDGIPDYTELTEAGAFGFSAVNTDSIGPIDALDTDSDNDCLTDTNEGLANYRNQTAPNADANVACTATPATSICDKNTGTCTGCNADVGGGALACTTAAQPYCNTSGALSGRCTECTSTKQAACVGAKPSCDAAIGACAACNGNTGAGTTAACRTATAPACQTSGALAGTCTQCNAGLTTLCPAFTPACSSTTGSCAVCNGHFGGAATAPCPGAAQPACNVAGPYNGRCTACSAQNTSLCPVTAPACDPNAGVCAKCDGDRGSGSILQCPNDTAPNCSRTGADQGTCKKCTSSADCGVGHTGPTCDMATGACIDIDTDGDGLQDETEILLGTDPTKTDSDGDGIDDKTEVTPVGGGAFAKVNTDGDLQIDAMDLDSDDDGIPDAEEARVGDAGPIRDTDNDGTPDYRDTDDDGDTISTKDEIADAKLAAVSDDIDGDGLKNWLDPDANGNTKNDDVDGRADDDGDKIPNYLDPKKDPPVPEAGASSTSSSSSSSGNVIQRPSSGASGSVGDAGAPTGAAPEDGVLEGSGCSTTSGPASSFMLFGLGAAIVGLFSRRRRRSRR